MKKKTDWVKKVSLLGLLITAGTGLNALAATNSVADNMGVSTQKPSFESSLESLERGTKIPTAEWHSSNGAYSFSGSAEKSTLYTEVYLTGDSWYNVTVKNLKASSDTSLSVQAYKKATFAADQKVGVTQTVKGQKSVNYTLTNNLTASDKVYLEFKAPSHFEGWIE